MPTVPDGYPHALDADELRGALKALGEELRSGGYSVNASTQYGPVIALGQSELQARIARQGSEELRDAIETFRTSSDKASGTLIFLTWVLVILTLVVVVATVLLLKAEG